MPSEEDATGGLPTGAPKQPEPQAVLGSNLLRPTICLVLLPVCTAQQSSLPLASLKSCSIVPAGLNGSVLHAQHGLSSGLQHALPFQSLKAHTFIKEPLALTLADTEPDQ